MLSYIEIENSGVIANLSGKMVIKLLELSVGHQKEDVKKIELNKPSWKNYTMTIVAI